MGVLKRIVIRFTVVKVQIVTIGQDLSVGIRKNLHLQAQLVQVVNGNAK